MRMILRSIVSLVVFISLSSASPIARADDRSTVEDKGSGLFEGTRIVGEDRGRSRRSDPPKSRQVTRSSIVEEAIEDIDLLVCDGEPAVHSPYDCPSYVPPPDLDHKTAEQLARRIVVRLQLPKPTPQFGPDPSVNEWNMAAVGYPIWLWTEGVRTVTASESAYGYTFTLRAHYRSTSFEMGDGHTKKCTHTTVYPRSAKPASKSPTCGYTYLEAARDGTYTVTATTHWDVDWSVAGFSGTLPGTHSASRELPVGELQAIVVK